MNRVKFGLTLPDRGVITGATTMDEMLELAEMADGQPTWDSVWVGDSILASPRRHRAARGTGGKDREGQARTSLLRQHAFT
jgi:hypothetical protein